MLVTNEDRSMAEVLRPLIAGAERVDIVSAYVSPAGCELLGLADIANRSRLRLVVGRAGAEGIRPETFRYLTALHSRAAPLDGGVRVASPPCHSKLYSGEDTDGPFGLIGSSNLTDNGMGEWIEANILVHGELATALQSEADRLWCESSLLESVRLVETSTRPPPAGRSFLERVPLEEPEEPDSLAAESAKLALSLLSSRTGDVPKGAGLNWWNGGGRARDPNEAYIALSVAALEHAEEVFGSVRPGTRILARTDDGERLELVLEGTQRGGAAKQISTLGDKRRLGRWLLRRRLGLAEGELVTREILKAYGRTDVEFTRIGTEGGVIPVVLMDFAPPPA